MDPEEFDEVVEEPFNVPDLSVMWDDILSRYRQMGFSIPLTDAVRGGQIPDNEAIAEFTWVHQQYRKFIGKKRGELLVLKGDMPKMLATIKDMIAKDSVVPDDRRTLVYQAMKSQWMRDLWNHMAWVVEQMDNGKDEDE